MTNSELASSRSAANMSGQRIRGFCPYHQGSTSHDLMIDPLYGRFSCIVCGATGWTEDGWRRWQRGATDSLGSAGDDSSDDNPNYKDG